ncbi:MAG: DMT family transporter [Bacillota bacterium]
MSVGTNSYWGEAALVCTTLIWGSTFALTKMVLDHLPPLLFLAVRFTLATIIMSIFFFTHLRQNLRHSWPAGVWVGLALAGAYITQTVGMETTSASKAAFITGLSVILVPIFQALHLRRLPQRSVLLGALLAGAGLTLLSGILGEGFALGVGDIWVTGCAIAFAIHILATGHYAGRVNIPTLTTIQFAVTALSCWITGLGLEQWPGYPPAPVWGIIFFLALFGTAGAFGMQTWAQRRLSPSRAAIILTLEPVFAAAFGFVILSERLAWTGYLGCVAIVAGTLVAELGPNRTMPSPQPAIRSPQ